MPTCSTRIRPCSRSTRSTRPTFPLSRPEITRTVSSLLNSTRRGGGAFFCATAICFPPGESNHLGRQRDNLHKPLVTQLPGNRTEYTGSDRLPRLVNQHGGVGIEPDIGPIFTPGLFAHTYD